MCEYSFGRARRRRTKTPFNMKKTAKNAGFNEWISQIAQNLARVYREYTTVCVALEPSPEARNGQSEQTNVYFQKIQRKLVKNT